MEARPPQLTSKFKIYAAFALGLATAIAMRALIVLSRVQPTWVRPVWYFAVLGNFVFFYYRFQITEKRKHAVTEHRLIEKMQSREALSQADRDAVIYLLSSIKKSPEHINYLIIFVFSLLAIAIDLALAYLSST